MPGTNYRVRHLSYNPINVVLMYYTFQSSLIISISARGIKFLSMYERAVVDT